MKLNISENDNSLDLGLAMYVHELVRLAKSEAEEIINTVNTSVRNWRHLATGLGISRVQQELKALAFSQAEN